MKLLTTQDLPLYECVTNKWWGCGLHLDSPDWNKGVCPGLNKTGSIIMDVRKALRKSTWTGDAMTMSPSKIIQAITILDDEIQGIPEPPKVPVMNEHFPDNVEMVDAREESNVDSTDDDGDLLEETDVDEESIDISAASSSSVESSSKLNVTGADRKLEIEKIKKWTVPKLNKPEELYLNHPTDKTRSQKLRNTLPNTGAAAKGILPQATSTPHPRGINRSLTIQAVQSKLYPKKQPF